MLRNRIVKLTTYVTAGPVAVKSVTTLRMTDVSDVIVTPSNIVVMCNSKSQLCQNGQIVCREFDINIIITAMCLDDISTVYTE